MKKIVLIILALFILAGCQQTDKQIDTTASTEEKESVQVLQVSNIDSFVLSYKEGQSKITQEDKVWSIDEKPSEIFGLFAQELDSLQGTVSMQAVKGEPVFSLILPEDTASFYKINENEWLLNYSKKVYELKNIGVIIQNFEETLFNGTQIEVSKQNGPIQIREGNRQFSYSQTTNLSEIEQAPLISGWFVSGYYQRDVSLNFQYTQYLLAIISDLRGLEQDKLPSDAVVTRTINFDDSEWQLYKDEKHYLLQNAQGKTWQLPLFSGELLNQPVFESMDRFLVLVMADALDKLSIETKDGNHLIEATHKNGNDGKIKSEFKLDDELIKEADFRKLYQYIAVISPEKEYQGEEYDKTPLLTMTYDFTSDKEKVQRQLVFYPLLEDSSQLAVSVDGNLDFIANQSQIDEMLKQLN